VVVVLIGDGEEGGGERFVLGLCAGGVGVGGVLCGGGGILCHGRGS